MYNWCTELSVNVLLTFLGMYLSFPKLELPSRLRNILIALFKVDSQFKLLPGTDIIYRTGVKERRYTWSYPFNSAWWRKASQCK
jgi:hypothetical protein